MATTGSTHRLDALLRGESLAVVSTLGEQGPYASLVAFVASGRSRLLFGTPRATRKFGNLLSDGRVSVLIDDRTGDARDVATASAATGLGVARELHGEERAAAVVALSERSPHLRDFYASPSVGVVEVAISMWYVVERFQDVHAISPGDG